MGLRTATLATGTRPESRSAQQWRALVAAAVADAARALSARQADSRGNREELGRRERKRPQLPLAKGFAARLGLLGSRAQRTARRAQPARGLTLSLCMIVKDEEEMLPGCLAAARETRA